MKLLKKLASFRAYIALRAAGTYESNNNEAGRGAAIPDGYQIVG